MNWKKASRNIQGIISSGRPYAQKLAGLDLPDVFVYWHPQTLKYAVAIPYGNAMEKKAQCEREFKKAGIEPLYSLVACEDTGWVPIHWPEGYSPLRRVKKYASAIETPAQLAVAGGFLGGTAGTLISLWKNSENDKMTFAEKMREAMTPALIGTGIGILPGIYQGVSHSRQTRPIKEDGTFGPAEVGFFKALGMNEQDLIKNSPTYALNYKNNTTMGEALDPNNSVVRRKKRGSVKESSFQPLATGDGHLINVDSFNRVVWDDTKNGFTQPENALLVTSAVSAARPCGSALVTPGAVIGTLVNAGIGYATAGVIGKTLGAMGALSPPAQQKLMELGTWGGMINGIGQAMLH